MSGKQNTLRLRGAPERERTARRKGCTGARGRRLPAAITFWLPFAGDAPLAPASNQVVNGKRLITRILAVLAAAAVFLLFVALAQGSAGATPIPPDVRKLAEQPQEAPPKLEPARAGWNGPETSATSSLMSAAQAAHVRAVRRALAIVVTPDPRALAAILAMILLLRKVRATREAQAAAVPAPAAEWQLPRAA